MDGKKIIISISIVLLLLFLSGCTQEATVNSDDMKKFVGKWQASYTDVRIFSSDGSCRYLGVTGTYTVKDGMVTIALDNGVKRTYDYHFSDDGKTLTLTNKNFGTTVYTKQVT